jgi:hypothetical protein
MGSLSARRVPDGRGDRARQGIHSCTDLHDPQAGGQAVYVLKPVRSTPIWTLYTLEADARNVLSLVRCDAVRSANAHKTYPHKHSIRHIPINIGIETRQAPRIRNVRIRIRCGLRFCLAFAFSAVQMLWQIKKSSQQNSQFAISEFAISREHDPVAIVFAATRDAARRGVRASTRAYSTHRKCTRPVLSYIT